MRRRRCAVARSALAPHSRGSASSLPPSADVRRSDSAASAAAAALASYAALSPSRVVIARSSTSSIDAASAFQRLSGGDVVVIDGANVVRALESGPAADALFGGAEGHTNFLIVELGSEASGSLASDDALVGRVADVVARKSHHRSVCVATALRSAGAGARALSAASSARRRSLLQTSLGASATWDDDFTTSDFLHMTPNIFLMIATSLMLAFFLLIGLSIMFSIKTPAQFWTEGQHKESLHRPGILDVGRTENDYIVQQRRVMG